MSDFGLTDTGFNIKRLPTIKTELEDDYKNINGGNIVVTPQSPQGQEIGLWANIISFLWEQGLFDYNAFNPNTATGVALSQLVLLNGLTRNPATKSTVLATITGTQGTIIPTGSLAATIQGSQFESIIEATIPVSGTIDVTFDSVVTGPIAAGAGTLTTIVNPISGWTAVTNAQDGLIGKDEETDAALRFRRAESTSLPASNIIDSLYSALFNIATVNDALVFVNNTPNTNVMGTPAFRYLSVVDGGTDAEVANAIYLNHTSGDKSFGTESVVIQNSAAQNVVVQFSRPEDIDIWVIVNITTFSNFPQNGDDLIKEALVSFGTGAFEADQCVNGFKIDKDVIYTQLFTPINSICGHVIDSLFIGTAASPTGTANIPITFNEISRWDVSRITVNT